ncbi:MAG: hypothetical protein IK137_02845 [Bacilli bacterium]|nr:hypothetical protein [Bacilli bacterium]
MQIIAKRKIADTARILMVISITLLVYGIILNISTIFGLVDKPTRGILSDQDQNSSVISITPSGDNEIVNSNGSNSRVSDADLDKKNNMFRNEIEKEFSVAVRYGKETEGYKVGGVTTEPITDSQVIYETLTSLYNTLSLYPPGIFKEIKDGGIPLMIILVNNYSEYSITGVTDSSYDYANISIAAVYDFSESFYHESYHYLERYMFKKKANFNSWDNLNPKDFQWNTIDGSLSYSNTFKENAYFVNNYAQTSAAEDRASTFEYMMAPSKASCLNDGTPIWKKANYMALTIETVFDTVSPDSIEYWERFIRS